MGIGLIGRNVMGIGLIGRNPSYLTAASHALPAFGMNRSATPLLHQR
jgi:hypothetical protein